MLSFRVGLLVSVGIGLFLSLFSALVINEHYGSWFPIISLSGGRVGGAPVMFVGFDQTSSFEPITGIGGFNPLLFVVNTLFWVTPFLLSFVVVRNGLMGWLMQAAWHRGVFVVVLLAPALLALFGFCSAILPFFDLPSFPMISFTDAAAGWLSIPSYEMALRLVKMAYLSFVGFHFWLLLTPLFQQHGRISLYYPVVAVGLLVYLFLIESPFFLGFLGQQWEQPFVVDRIVLFPPNTEGKQPFEFRLTSFQLPQENTIYAIRCYVLDGRVNPNHSLGRYLKYVKQVCGTLYGMADGTYLKDDQFVELPALHATITLAPNSRPKYLFVEVEFNGRMEGYGTHEGYVRWYIVPLKKHLRLDNRVSLDTP